jgi:type I restriction enzyme S subunit
MMSNRVLARLPMLMSSPEGIKRLRELILEWALSGKLTSQQNSVSNVYDSPVTPDEMSNWKRQQLGDLIQLISGQHLTPEEYFCSAEPGSIPYLTGPAEFGKVTPAPTRYTKERRAIAKDGDILLTVKGAGVGKTNIVCQNELAISRQLMAMRPVSLDRDFLHLLLKLLSKQFQAQAVGIAIPGISRGDVLNTTVIVPPHAEQKRIVAKVDELMALCDQLEAQKADAEKTHTNLVKALLDSLLASNDRGEFLANWKNVCEKFDILFTTQTSIDQLSDALLHLAVIGKLVDDEASGHATEIVEAIQRCKKALVESGAIAKEKPLAPIKASETPCKLPPRWCWVRIGDLALRTDYGISEKTFDTDEGIPVLKMGDIQRGSVVLGRQKKVDRQLVPEELMLQPGDLLYNRTNSAELVGKTGLYSGPTNQYTFASYLIRIRVAKDLIVPEYLNMAMNSGLFRRTQVLPHIRQQCGQANVNGTIMRNMMIPIPPYDVQRRICERFNEILSVCRALSALVGERQRINGLLSNRFVDVSGGANNDCNSDHEQVSLVLAPS